MRWPTFSKKPPAFLDPKNRRGNKEDQANVQRETEGDISKFKLNHIMMFDETIREIDRCLRTCRFGTQYAKLYSGQYSDRFDELPEFVNVCKKNDVTPCIGGGQTEAAIKEGRLLSYVQELDRLGIDTIEISNSLGDTPPCDDRTSVKSLCRDFREVLIEIGTKNNRQYQTRDEWKRDLDFALENNASKIILEGTGVGEGGIYNYKGAPNNLLVTELMQRAGDRKDRLLLEAPRLDQQAYWTHELFGWNVGLGNLPPDVEALQKTDALRLNAMKPDVISTIERRRNAHAELLQELLSVCEQESIDPNLAVFHDYFHATEADDMVRFSDWKIRLREGLVALSRQPSPPRVAIPRIIQAIIDMLRD